MEGAGKGCHCHSAVSQAADGRRRAFPWSGRHHSSGARLHLAERADRKRLLILFEGKKQILCAQIGLCGVAAEWKWHRVAKQTPGCIWCIVHACLGGGLSYNVICRKRWRSCWPCVCYGACDEIGRTFRPCEVFVIALTTLCREVGFARFNAVALRCDAFAEMHPGF
jgi:hypothetical protein